MIVEDIYRITSQAQNVDIYNPKTKVFVFTGACSDIPLSCLDIPVSQIVAVDNTLAIMVNSSTSNNKNCCPIGNTGRMEKNYE